MKQPRKRPRPRIRPGSEPPRRPAPRDGGHALRDGAPTNTRTRGPVAGRTHVSARVVEAVASPAALATATAAIAEVVERAVLEHGRRADRSLAQALSPRRDFSLPDQRFVSAAVFALFRWKGWIDPLGPKPIQARLMLSVLLDSPAVPPPCRVWAKELGRDPNLLFALGDAPNWPAKGDGFKRLLGGQPVTADPWRLFPPWLREHLPLPPGGGAAKTRFVEQLQALQTISPLWVRAVGPDPDMVWDELRRAGVRPWVHRRMMHSAKLEPDVDVYHLEPFARGTLEIQDLASQAVGLVCDPDPGERWWDACAGAGGKALHLSALMGGKGVVVASDVHDVRLKEAVRRARRSPYRNLTTRAWDGRHVAGKPASFDGVLVDAPCSAIGTWRRNPDARWSTDRQAIPRLAALQGQLLKAAAAGVRPGGTLVFSVCTLTLPETQLVLRGFLESTADFSLDPFPNPLTASATDGTLTIWPNDADSDAMFIARMVRGGGGSPRGMRRAPDRPC
jgi:16S rRNA (cytosine967-C5)-methyltransferase